jgi:antirestriction protein ArdC
MAEKLDVYEIVTERMLAQLEAGTVPWRKPWNAGHGPRNLNGNLYRGVNVFLLGMSEYESPFWLTFRQAKEHGGTVRKGEKSTLIVFWKRLLVKDKDTGEAKVIPLLRYYRVFNLEQTDGVKPTKRVLDYEATRSDEHVPNLSAEQVIAGYADAPTIREAGDRAFYVPSSDAITVPPRAAFDNIADFYLTLFHEMGHSTGHKDRLNRFTGDQTFGSHDYGREELIAEMTSAFLGAETGIAGTDHEVNSAAYLGSWIAAIKADPRAIVVAAGAAQRAADLILGRTWDEDKAKGEEAELVTA